MIYPPLPLVSRSFFVPPSFSETERGRAEEDVSAVCDNKYLLQQFIYKLSLKCILCHVGSFNRGGFNMERNDYLLDSIKSLHSP